MDYVTRQFINLTKKFRKELRPLLAKLDRTLDKQTRAISENTKAQQEKRSPQPNVITTVDLPESIEIHHRENEATQQRRYQNRSLLLALVTFLTLAIYSGLVCNGKK